MQLNHITDGIIEHEKAGSFLYSVGWFCNIHQVKNNA